MAATWTYVNPPGGARRRDDRRPVGHAVCHALDQTMQCLCRGTGEEIDSAVLGR